MCWSTTARRSRSATRSTRTPRTNRRRPRHARQRPAPRAPPASCTRNAAIAHHLVAGDAVTDDEALACVRSAGNDALARGAWDEAARYFEAAITRPQPPGELAELHRRAGPEPPRQPAAGAGGGPLRGRARAPRPRRRRRHPGRAAPLAHPLRHRHPRDAGRGVRPRPARGAGRRGGGRRPRAGGRGAGRAVAVVLGRVAHEAGHAVRRSGRWRSPSRARRPLRVRARHHHAERAAVGALRPARFAGDVGGRRRPRARRDTTSRCSSGGPVFRMPLVLTWLGRFDEAEHRARSSAATSPSARSTRWSSDCRSPRSRRSRSRAASTTTPSSTRTARCSCSGSRATTGPPGSSCRRWRARTSPAASSSRRATRSPPGRETADELEQASVDLFSPVGRPRASAASSVQGAPLPGLPRDRWSAATRGRRWRSSSRSRKARPATSRAAHDLLVKIEDARRRADRRHRLAGGASPRRRAGPPRRRGRARRRHAASAPSRIATRSAPRPSIARAQADLAVILPAPGRPARPRSRCSTRRSPASASCGLEPDAARAAQLSGTDTVEPFRSSRIAANAGVDHPLHRHRRLDPPHRGARRRPLPRPRPAGRAGDHRGDRRQRRHRRHRHQPGRRLHRPLPDRRARPLDAARRCIADVSTTGLHLHVAVHQGELIVDGDRIYGGAVNMAARVCGLSGPDEILVSAHRCTRVRRRSRRRALRRPRRARAQGHRRAAARSSRSSRPTIAGPASVA